MAASLKILVGVMLLAGFQSSLLGGVPAESADSRWVVRTWQTDEGLPNNIVTGLSRTADGYLWVATVGGLARFDGVTFEKLTLPGVQGVPNRPLRQMYVDRRNRFWLVIDRGLVVRVQGKSVRTFDLHDYIVSIAEDVDGRVWFATRDRLFRITEDTLEQVDSDLKIPGQGAVWLAQDERGELWFARGKGVGVIRHDQARVLVTLEAGPARLAARRGGGVWICTPTHLLALKEGEEPEFAASMPPRVSVKILQEDCDGNVWIGTSSDGLLVAHNKRIEPVAVSHSDVTTLLADAEGNVWVGTRGGGLHMLRAQAMSVVGRNNGLPYEGVRSVCEDSAGYIWVALQSGELVRGWDGIWTPVTSSNGWPGGNARCVAPAPNGGVWIGTTDRGLQRLNNGSFQQWDQRNGLGSRSVRALLAGMNGDLWITTDSPSRLLRFREGSFQVIESPFPTRSMRSMVETADGTVWLGTSDGKLLRVQGDSLVSEPISSGDAPPVRCLQATPDGSLWIGYAGSGLGLLRDGRYSRFTTRQGLCNDFISQILPDGSGGIWVAAGRGLFRVALEDLLALADGRVTHLRSLAFGKDDGLPSLQPVCETSPGMWRGHDGQLWFSTQNGLLTVQPNRVRDNPSPPPVLLQEVKVDEQSIAMADSQSPFHAPDTARLKDLREPSVSLQLPPEHKKLEFIFAALSFASPMNVHFRYRLEGFDTDWVEAGAQRSAKYPRLPSGRYRFEVVACNESGVWSNPAAWLAFGVQPFWWDTWWFRSSLLVVVGGVMTALVRFVSHRQMRQRMAKLERQAALNKERARISQDLHDDLGAGLTQISLASAMAQNPALGTEVAGGLLRDIGSRARQLVTALDGIVWAVNPQNDRVVSLASYFCQHAQRFLKNTPISCRLNVPADLPSAALDAERRHSLFLAFQEALHNAVQHSGATELELAIAVTDGALKITVRDNGRGLPAATVSAPTGLPTTPPADGADGLRNMRERLERLGGHCELVSEPGRGTRVCFHLPLGGQE